MTASLFSPLSIGNLTLPNRMVMAPMTRGRAEPDGTPAAIMADYYSQRATAGLIITEATSISEQGKGWLNAPGIYTDAHEEGWRQVISQVHAKGGRIFLQLWHMGRVSHPDYQGGALPVGPSAIAAAGESTTPEGKKPYVTPRALTRSEIDATVQDYAAAAERAIDAGFDGVEIHGANGYLIDQFLRDSSNQRTDIYGGSIANRARFLQEVTQAVTGTVGAEKVGMRLSPRNPLNGMHDSNPVETFTHAAQLLNGFGLAYMHVMEPLTGHPLHVTGEGVTPHMRAVFKNPLIANGGYTKEKGERILNAAGADAIAFGTPFLANPDLVKRFQENAPLNTPNPKTFYTHGVEGYLDYPLRTNS